MQNGNWIPISKNLLQFLPKDREYTKLEAAFSVQTDYDINNTVTVAGYSALWRWSRSKVRRFLDDMNIKIIYPDETLKKRNQKGHITIHKRDINGTYNRHIRCIDSKQLEKQKDIKGTYKGHKKDIKGDTTKDPNPNPKDSKKPKKFTPPLLEDVKSYFKENGYTEESGEKAFYYYESGNWKDSTGKPVKSWKQKMRGVWFKDENKTTRRTHTTLTGEPEPKTYAQCQDAEGRSQVALIKKLQAEKDAENGEENLTLRITKT